MKKIILLLGCLYWFFPTNAQEKLPPEVPSPMIFIYDASGSMWGQMEGKTKMEIASDVLSQAIEDLPENQQLGLVAYGHRKKGDCRDVETLVAMDNRSKQSVVTSVNGIKPLGKTPLAHATSLVINQLREAKQKATIILITDGIESCDGDICALVTAAKKEGIDFKLHIVGFGLKDSETQSLKCAAQAGEGSYYDAADASGLGSAMGEVVTQTIDKSKGNFGVYAEKNGQPIDAWVRAYRTGTKNEADFKRTYGDTVYLFLPQEKYDLEFKALAGSKTQPIVVTGVQSYNEKIAYQVVSFDAGKIEITTTNNMEGWDCTSKVYDVNGDRVAGRRTYGKPIEIEVNPGMYSVEVTALKMSGLTTTHVFKQVEVLAAETTPIAHDFKTGTAHIGVAENGTLVDCTVSIYTADRKTRIAGGRSYTSPSSNPRPFILNPGTYAVRFRGRKNGVDTQKWIEISVAKGQSITKMYDW